MSEQHTGYHVTYADNRAVSSAVKAELRRLTRTDASNYRGPEPSLVRALIESSGWQQREVADLLRVNVSTVRRWTANSGQSQSREMPFAAWVVLLHATGNTVIEAIAA